jgi:hypothetical protein
VERVGRRRWGEESIWETLSLILALLCAVLCWVFFSLLLLYSVLSLSLSKKIK